MKETDELSRHDHEAIARAAIATMFNWLDDPSDATIQSASGPAHISPANCRRVWSEILARLRNEAGF
ncbi:hypothetical protein [Novosphingobium album (ex Liu et al. 2023)]|uniref:hypothetical protein n=1 Tax=Novosphingobium album (ex Liu et al. 2023) TaxID=3031130 RepID=UPI0023AF88E4|nr:hypothetical protein [Novosphingobium album (ex Liu et al. 2023)]